jgi:acid phosphatase family membrane protein YuiD
MCHSSDHLHAAINANVSVEHSMKCCNRFNYEVLFVESSKLLLITLPLDVSWRRQKKIDAPPNKCRRSRRSSSMITYCALFIGSILNATVGKILKKILNHDRPAELELSDKVKLKPSDGGMPSSHAMSLSFIGTVILFGVITPAAANNISISIAAGALIVIYSAIALRYRVRDHLHTLDQIIVGYVLGLFNAFVWLRFAVSTNHGDTAGPILTLVTRYMISSETNQFPLVGLVVPVLVGVLVVGSLERRIGVWLKERKQTDEEDVEEKTK